MTMTENDALEALLEAFEDRYVLKHPHLNSCVPDAMTVSLEDFELAGFEIKTSRHDWLQERRSSYKNHQAIAVSDFWSMIAEPSVIKIDDLPEKWGLYRVTDGRLVCAVEPTRLQPRSAIDRSLARTILLHVARSIPMSEQIRKVRDQAYSDAFLELFSNKPLREMDEGALIAFSKMIADNVHQDTVEGLVKLQSELARLYSSVTSSIESIPVPHLDKRVLAFPNNVLEYGKRCRERLLSDPKMMHVYQGMPEVLDRVVEEKMKAYWRLESSP